ncbi:MAG: hypothetical protein JNM81_16510 [Rhodospirillaceae bacterium]|nr:hypothetical protein [Rhodospirillaceae bacterium]
MSAAALSNVKPSPTPPWLITFVDLVFLLLSFFVLMFAMSQPDAQRYAQIVESTTKEFKPGALGDDSFVNSRTYVQENDDNVDDMTYLGAALKSAIAQSPNLKKLQFRSTERALVVSLPGALSGNGRVVPKSVMPALFDLSGVLANIQNPIAVVGAAGDTAESWSQGLVQANVIAATLKDAGYDRPIATLAQMPAGERTNNTIEIMIMADPQHKDLEQSGPGPKKERMP